MCFDVILSGAKNPSVFNAKAKRDSSRRIGAQNDGFPPFSASCLDAGMDCRFGRKPPPGATRTSYDAHLIVVIYDHTQPIRDSSACERAGGVADAVALWRGCGHLRWGHGTPACHEASGFEIIGT